MSGNLQKLGASYAEVTTLIVDDHVCAGFLEGDRASLLAIAERQRPDLDEDGRQRWADKVRRLLGLEDERVDAA